MCPLCLITQEKAYESISKDNLFSDIEHVLLSFSQLFIYIYKLRHATQELDPIY